MKLIATNCAFLMLLVAIMQTEATPKRKEVMSKSPVKPRKVVFEKFDIETDEEWVVLEEAITIVGDDTALNVQTTIKKSLPDKSLISVEVAKEDPVEKDEFGMLLKSGDVPVCEMLKNATTTQPMLKGLIQKLLQYTNMPYQCPLPTGDFWVKDFVADATMIPALIPEGRYRLNLDIYQPLPGRQLVYKSELIFSLTSSK